jgi:hypothetical protein
VATASPTLRLICDFVKSKDRAARFGLSGWEWRE